MSSKELCKKIYEVFEPFRWKMIVNLGFIAVIQLLFICGPLTLGALIDALTKHRPWSVVIGWVALMGALRAAICLINYLNSKYEILYLDFDFPQYISLYGIDKIMAFSIGQHHNQNSGIKLGLIGKGEGGIRNLLNDFLYNLMPGICQLVITMILLMKMNFQLGLVYVFGIMLYAFMSVRLHKKFSPLLTQEEKLYNDSNRLSGDMVKNVMLVKVNCKTDFVRSEFKKKFAEISQLGKRIWLDYSWQAVYRNLIYAITLTSVIALGVHFLSQGKITVGFLTTFILWVSNISGTLNNMNQVQRRITKSWGSVRDYFENILTEPAIKDVPGAKQLEKIEGKIEFRNVNFSYPTRNNAAGDSRQVLKGVDFTIQPNEKVAFVGRSGAGKSTITQLLIRAYDPSSGQILIDGHDLRDLQLSSYLEQVGLVEQDVSMFDNTLAYNLQFGVNDKSTITKATMDEVAEACRINEFFHLLEDGYNTMIGEKGVKLSGGQKQRVGIARALIKNPQILILDEATSSLDTENEAMIRASIEKASAGRTTIIVAHRLSTIKWVNRIFVMDDGEVVNIGSHDELLENSPVYQNLMKHQSAFV
jgi:ABC-type multidrug transport system fused ATPase/permease subunit